MKQESATAYAQYRVWRAFACPVCDQPAGWPCRNPDNGRKSRSIHAARWRVAGAAAREAVSA